MLVNHLAWCRIGGVYLNHSQHHLVARYEDACEPLEGDVVAIRADQTTDPELGLSLLRATTRPLRTRAAADPTHGRGKYARLAYPRAAKRPAIQAHIEREHLSSCLSVQRVVRQLIGYMAGAW